MKLILNCERCNHVHIVDGHPKAVAAALDLLATAEKAPGLFLCIHCGGSSARLRETHEQADEVRSPDVKDLEEKAFGDGDGESE